MKPKIKSVVFVISLVFNAFFFLSIIAAFGDKKSTLFYHFPGEDYSTAAAVINIPSSSKVSFEHINLHLKPGQTATMQFVVVSNDSQANALFNALYDPNIISIEQTGYGLVITAVNEGETLIQHFTNDGIHNLALVMVEK